jgi:hypothetical protein
MKQLRGLHAQTFFTFRTPYVDPSENLGIGNTPVFWVTEAAFHYLKREAENNRQVQDFINMADVSPILYFSFYNVDQQMHTIVI